MLAIVTITKPNVDCHHLGIQTKFHCTSNVQIPNCYQISANYSLIPSSSPCVCKSSILNCIHLFFHPNVYWVYNLTTRLSSESLFKDALSLRARWFLVPTLSLEVFNSALHIYQKHPSLDKAYKGLPPNSIMEDHYVTY